MNRFWSDNTNKIVPYTPGEQPDSFSKIIKLNTNENPYAPSPKVSEVLKKFDIDLLRRYPNPDGIDAKAAFVKKNGLKEENVFVGNGSDEVLGFCFKAFFGGSKKVNFPDITYSFYSVYCDLFEISYNIVPLLDDFYPDVDAMCRAEGGVVIANPNAPTSMLMKKEDIVKILKAHPDDVVIIDEAYVEFGGESCIDLTDEYENLLVVRTMSKSYSMAGMRVGFAVGNRELIKGINCVKNSFNSYPIDRIANMTAAASISDDEYHVETINKVINTRVRISDEFVKLGFDVKKSYTNFIFVSKNGLNAEKYYEYLKNNDILVRYFNKPRINGFVRITIGTDDEMDALLRKTEEFLNENR